LRAHGIPDVTPRCIPGIPAAVYVDMCIGHRLNSSNVLGDERLPGGATEYSSSGERVASVEEVQFEGNDRCPRYDTGAPLCLGGKVISLYSMKINDTRN